MTGKFSLKRLILLEDTIAFLSTLNKPATCEDHPELDSIITELVEINNRRKKLLSTICNFDDK